MQRSVPKLERISNRERSPDLAADAATSPLTSTYQPFCMTAGGNDGGEATGEFGGRHNTSIVASSAAVTQPVIIEYCCGPENQMCQIRNKCKVIRVTKEEMDQTTRSGRQKALNIAEESPAALLWTRLPCTAGCPWWGINDSKPGGRFRRLKHLNMFLAILRA